ncbi:MAG: bifunctional precorrin-2 dehydrogenase/sirohydrochlorin ferrochelatase [Deltaproteobacteria bacterium]|mgnify:FL=1|nr:bifunctional precorrin-2 dehydrogenase/sirohydrochlorin ferrochelatase [Deltaproteobacteria bacterium]
MDYPLFVHIAGRLCVVVGGGPVGRRKAAGLAAAGARVRLIAPAVVSAPELPVGVEWVRRCYREGDLHGAFLAFAAAGDRSVNAAVAAEARRAGIPVNVADRPAEGDFQLPALLRRGLLTVAVATGGGSPAAAALVRDHLAGVLGEEWGVFVELASRLRERFSRGWAVGDYAAVCRRLAAAGFVDCLAAGDTAAADALLARLAEKGLTLASLGIDLQEGNSGADGAGK